MALRLSRMPTGARVCLSVSQASAPRPSGGYRAQRHMCACRPEVACVGRGSKIPLRQGAEAHFADDARAALAGAARASARSMSTIVRSKVKPFKAPAVFPDGTIAPLSIESYKGKWVVLFYYPLDWTFVCPTEIVDFSEHSDKFSAVNCAVIGASIDSANSHLAWTQTPRTKGGLGAMKIPLLADVSKDVARSLGFLVENPADDLNGIALRGTVILDPTGTIRHVTINDAPVGRSVEETLRLVQAFQYTDKHGEVCPSGWKPGAKSMKADPKGSQEYFSQLK